MEPSLVTPRSSFPWLFPILILVLGVAGSCVLYFLEEHRAKESIVDQARSIAIAIDPEDIALLSGSTNDLNVEAYQELKTYLARVRHANEGVRFTYVFGKNERGEAFFYADSEDPSSPDYSPPGQVYYESTPFLLNLFQKDSGAVEGPYEDRWGSWISAYAPIIDESGKTVALFGMDFPSGNYLRDIWSYAVLPGSASVVLALLAFGFILVSRKKSVSATA